VVWAGTPHRRSLRRLDYLFALAHFPRDPRSRKADVSARRAHWQSAGKSDRADPWSHLAIGRAVTRRYSFAAFAEVAGKLDVGNAKGFGSLLIVALSILIVRGVNAVQLALVSRHRNGCAG